MSFTHLHVHTEYSLLDGASRIDVLVSHAKKIGMDSIAITDHGVMYGVVDFYKKAIDKGIKPIIGCEVYMTPNMHENGVKNREAAHLVLLCKNNIGYQNLIKLVSLGFTDGFYYKPRIDYDTLEKYSEGLICLSACLAGDIPRLLLDGQFKSAKELALKLKGMFNDDFYLELQDHGILEQTQINNEIVRLSEDTGIKLVATNDVHYTFRNDADAHDVLLCVQTQTHVEDTNRMRFEGEEFYLKSEEEMRELFKWKEEAIDNTKEIADKCDIEFDFSTTHLPQFDVEGYDDRHDVYLYEISKKGLEERYGEVDSELEERLNLELDIINSMGYTDYFLIVWDFVSYAKSVNIETGCRGSGAASIVSYCLGITEIDPLKYNLLFERFLNPERISMPDFDIDFCYERRQEVIDYVIDKYGADHVAQIITFGTMAARAVIRDVGRALGMSYADVDAVAKQVPTQLGITIEKALEMNPQLKETCEIDEDVKRLVDVAKRLEGLPRHASTHAAGVVITKLPVTDYVPLNRNGDIITTQYPMDTLEELGLLKMDFLGLRTLTVINDAVELARESTGDDIDIHTTEFDDHKVYELISSGDTDGVFQLESAGMRTFIKDMKPDDFEDIIAAISLYRPGPMDFIPKYIQGKRDPKSVVYDHPILEKSLDVTYGCMVYQEQVMQVVRDIAGYSLGRSDLVRRAMSKKKHKVMVQERDIFINGIIEDGEVKIPGAIRNGVSAKVANKIYDDMMDFANYAFNKPHGACYAMVAYRTAWLKIYYPVEFMAAIMNSVMGNSGKVASYIHYCRQHNIQVLPPDINTSNAKFSVNEGNIKFGLAAVKNVGKAVIENILIERRKVGIFKDIFDFCQRCSSFINKRMVQSLIFAGAFDSTDAYRSQLLYVYESFIDGTQRANRNNHKDQISLFEMMDVDVIPRPSLPKRNELNQKELLRMEKEMTGVYISGHPLAEYKELLDKFKVNSNMFKENDGIEDDSAFVTDGQMVELGGLVAAKQDKATRNNDMMSFVTLEDLFGSIEVIVFPRQLKISQQYLENDAIISVKGKVTSREGEDAKLIAEQILPLKVNTEKLYMRIENHHDKDILDTIKDMLKNHTGTTPVYVLDERDNKKYRFNRELWINSNQILLGKLNSLLGSENVKVISK